MAEETKRKGAKIKLDDTITDTITTAILGGLSIKKACKAAGISEPTYYNWLEQARKGKEPYVKFLKEVETAQIQFEQALLGTIINEVLQNNSTIDAKWLLERKFPNEYGQRKPSEAETSEDQAKIVVEILDDVEPDREITVPATKKSKKKTQDEVQVTIV